MKELTEEELQSIENVVNRLNGTKYLFSYNTIEDIRQEARIICLDAVQSGSFRGDSTLETFLTRVVFNGLNVLERQSRLRTESTCECGSCKTCIRKNAKNNVSSLASLDNVDEEHLVTYDDDFDYMEILTLIDQKLPPELRPDYLRMRYGEKITDARKNNIFEVIKEIVNE